MKIKREKKAIIKNCHYLVLKDQRDKLLILQDDKRPHLKDVGL